MKSGNLAIACDREIGETPHSCHRERARIELGEPSTSRRTPTKPVAGNVTSGTSHKALSGVHSWLRSAWDLLRAAVSEIFDESAYRRFLERTGLTNGTASYRAFVAERDSLAARKPRCC